MFFTPSEKMKSKYLSTNPKYTLDTQAQNSIQMSLTLEEFNAFRSGLSKDVMLAALQRDSRETLTRVEVFDIP